MEGDMLIQMVNKAVSAIMTRLQSKSGEHSHIERGWGRAAESGAAYVSRTAVVVIVDRAAPVSSVLEHAWMAAASFQTTEEVLAQRLDHFGWFVHTR